MIILNSILFSLPSIVVTILGGLEGSVLVSYRMYKVVVYFEIAFVVEDIFLEVLYIYHFWRYLQDVPAFIGATTQKHMKRTFYLLLMASLVVVVCDLAGLILLYMKILLLRYSILGLLYGIKLNTEFFVLNRLVETVKMKDDILRRGNMSVGAVVNETTSNSAGEDLNTKYSSVQGTTVEQDLKIEDEQVAAAPNLIEQLRHSTGEDYVHNVQNVPSKLNEPLRGGEMAANLHADYAETSDLERQYLSRFIFRNL
jgi:hypothetical protein